MMRFVLLACVAALVAAESEPILQSLDNGSQLLKEIGQKYAIFQAESSASKTTTFTIQHTKITIQKHSEAESSALVSRRPQAKIIVTDAAAKGLVCLPKGKVTVSGTKVIESTGDITTTHEGTGDIVGESGAIEGGVEGGIEGEKSEKLVVGQGKGIVASVSASASAGGGAASASASGGGAASSASASGGAAASSASSGQSAASSAAGEGSAASSAAGEGSAASSAAGEGSAASSAAGEGSAASSAAGEGSAASSASSEGSAASSASGEGSAASSASGEGSAASSAAGEGSAATTGEGSTSTTTVSEGEVSVDVSGGGEAAAIGDGYGIHITGDGHQQIIDERFCECVPSYLCDEEGYINTAGVGIINIRSFADNKGPRAYASKCKLDETCCKHRDKEAIGWVPTSCGTRSPIRLDKRIVGGEVSGIGRHPWMVAVIVSVPDAPDEYLCGGSLVKDDVVLTGAHCVNKYHGARLIARVGEWDSCNVDEVYPHQDIEVLQVVQHEQFDAGSLAYDVALLKLSHPVETTTHINTICLPDAEHAAHIDFNHCVTTGWGKESFEKSQYTNILKEVPLHVVEHDQCESALRTTRLSRWFKLHETFTCAGGVRGVDACTGDGGGGLMCRIPGDYDDEEKFVQVGLVAWGIGCGQEGIPGVYADVIHLLPWISTHIAELHHEEEEPYP